MSDAAKPTIPEVIERFRAYHSSEPAWGSLHIVLDDNNVRDEDVAFCRQQAEEDGDEEGLALADILARMSKTQRLKLGQIA